MSDIQVAISPGPSRYEYIRRVLWYEGLPMIDEDPRAAYCPISITSVHSDLKPHLQARQNLLMEVLRKVGLSAYDPRTAPLSPDIDLSVRPDEVYPGDYIRIAQARFFVGHNILPSDGKGTEIEIAKNLNRISVVLMDKNIRVSRMQPHRTIYLQYENFENQIDEFEEVFKLLKEYEPGIGFVDGNPILLGFKNSHEPVVLTDLVYSKFPHLKYEYDGEKPVVRLKPENPELFYEHSN